MTRFFKKTTPPQLQGLPKGTFLASRKRRVLGLYIDYLVYGLILDFIWYMFANEHANLMMKFLILSAFEFLMFRRWGSIGFYLLSIERGHLELLENGMVVEKIKTWLVQPKIKNNEHWITILVGVIFLKSAVTTWIKFEGGLPQMPGFNVEINEVATSLFIFAQSLISVAIGGVILKLSKYSIPIVIINGFYSVTTILATWNEWDPWLAEYIRTEYFLMGRPVRQEQIDFMQFINPEYMLAATIILAIAVLFNWKRFIR